VCTGVRRPLEQEWEAAGQDATTFAATELKSALEGLARHLFGDVECRWWGEVWGTLVGLVGLSRSVLVLSRARAMLLQSLLV
jgi:hypothetical protein